MSEHKKMKEYMRQANSDLQYMSQFHHQRVFWYSWRNKRRSFDGAFPMQPFIFFPLTLPTELKGIAV